MRRLLMLLAALLMPPLSLISEAAFHSIPVDAAAAAFLLDIGGLVRKNS